MRYAVREGAPIRARPTNEKRVQSETHMSETPSLLTRLTNPIRNMPVVLKRVLSGLAVLVVGGVAGWIGHGVLAGPADVPNMRIYDDWRLLCPALKDKKESCEMSQDVVDSKSGQQVARLVLARDKDNTTVMAVTVPLGVLLEPGLGLKLSKDDVRVFQYKTCTEAGCLAVIPVNAQMEGTLASTPDFSVTVAGRDGKTVELPLSTKGFTVARKAYLNDEAKRNSWWRRLWS
jgi:invasion protein IalB